MSEMFFETQCSCQAPKAVPFANQHHMSKNYPTCLSVLTDDLKQNIIMLTLLWTLLLACLTFTVKTIKI